MGKRTKKMRQSLIKSKREVVDGGNFNSNDIVIPVMGKTGVGKSTFINTLMGTNQMEVGHEIVSCTADLVPAAVDSGWITQRFPALKGRRIIIVDTPGFDDTYHADSEILRRIGVWLASSYSAEMKLGGIIYLQNIAERRMEGASRRNLDMFQKLCGSAALGRVILGTTSWQEVRPEVGERRETELREKFWKEMIVGGSTTMRFTLQQASARQILEVILGRVCTTEARPFDSRPEPVLKIQEELVELRKYIPQTDAGKKLLFSLEEILEMHKKIQAGDSEEEKELQTKLQSLKKQTEALRLPFFTRIKSALGF